VNTSTLRALLERHGLKLKKELGQNFLVDDELARRLVGFARVEPGDHVLEIGTGLGVLTRALAERAASVTTVEIDSGLVRVLKEEALLPSNTVLIHSDVLDLDLEAVVAERGGGARMRLVANLPYASATPLLRRLLDLTDRFSDWSVMLQREVALRLVAQPGSREYSSFTVLHQLVADVFKERELAPGSFFPRPQVRSVFVRVVPRRDGSAPSREELAWIEGLLRPVFGQRRKTLGNGLRAAGFDPRPPQSAGARALSAVGIGAGVRAETLDPSTLRALANALRSSQSSSSEPGPSEPTDPTDPGRTRSESRKS
jgi:16S rRNA (adenine1518-N6/adenine1519-N6)-dimethyltransferase